MSYRDASELDLSRFKIGNASCAIGVVRNKVAQGRKNFIYLFSTALNMLIPVDLITKKATTVLYLDGREGYDYKR